MGQINRENRKNLLLIFYVQQILTVLFTYLLTGECEKTTHD